jgi:hypothetical protein
MKYDGYDCPPSWTPTGPPDPPPSRIALDLARRRLLADRGGHAPGPGAAGDGDAVARDAEDEVTRGATGAA